LTVRVNNIPLERIFSEIASLTGIEVFIHAPAEELVSREFSDLSLEDGLKKLARGYSHVFVYDPGSPGRKEERLKAIIIYPKTAAHLSEKPKPRVISDDNETLPKERRTPMESLSGLLLDKDPEVREEAVDLLGESKDDRAISHLIGVLRSDENADVRASAADALGDLGYPAALDGLIEALSDSDAMVRESAVDALAEIGGEQAIQALVDTLADEDDDVREAAADGLKRLLERQ
jgi:hypothetical protein